MASFSYKGRAADGKLVTGTAPGDTVDQVAQRLLGTGVTPLEITPQSVVASSIDLEKLGRRIGLGAVTTSDLVMFSRQMYTITRAGIPLLRGMRGLAASTHNAILRETWRTFSKAWRADATWPRVSGGTRRFFRSCT